LWNTAKYYAENMRKFYRKQENYISKFIINVRKLTFVLMQKIYKQKETFSLINTIPFTCTSIAENCVVMWFSWYSYYVLHLRKFITQHITITKSTVHSLLQHEYRLFYSTFTVCSKEVNLHDRALMKFVPPKKCSNWTENYFFSNFSLNCDYNSIKTK